MDKIRGLFATPGRAMLTTLVIVAILGSITIGAVFAATISNRAESQRAEQENVDIVAESEDLSQEEAVPEQEVITEEPEQSQETADTADVTDNNGGKISQSKAESIALKDAGLNKGQVTHLYSYYEVDDGYPQYEVQFYKGTMEYDYSIDADSGMILEKDVESIYD